MFIELDNVSIQITRKSIKHLYVRINAHTGDVFVSAPHRLPIELIKQHLFTKRDWIDIQRKRALAKTPMPHLHTPGFNHQKAKESISAQLEVLIPKWEAILNVQVNAFSIRAMRTRWGSCNTVKKRITINLNLIHKPSVCLEYVVVHELIHLIEANHSQRFYSLMEKFMPDWKDIQKQLNA